MDVRKSYSEYDFDGTWKHSPFGLILVQKDYFCIRCFNVKRFKLTKKEFNGINGEHDTPEYTIKLTPKR